MRTLLIATIILGVVNASLATEYHVSKKGIDSNPGTLSAPFLTIMQAVKVTLPGDTITVHAGTYREWINPLRGGDGDLNRILYRAAPGEIVEIKGSEVTKGWTKFRNGVWKITLPNSFFDTYNPFKDTVFGDWFIRKGRIHHTGEVFLNGIPLYEMESLEKVIDSKINFNIKVKEGSDYTWYCTTDSGTTTIWANFHKYDPNKELVEITTRPTCIYPKKQGINFITIRGFHISQAATQWAAPTAEQVGMVATHWNKGWIIENNVISDSKCSGITLGKERETGHNVWSNDAGNINRDGNIHYIEVIFNVLRNHWNKEHVGSHIVRNNTIFNCGQAGICGSMGAVFSTIENNHIFNVWINRLYEGWEIAGIKFHAAIDVTIRKNRIHDSGRGIWLDWMTQGTRVSQNIMYDNDKEDLFIEVNHGPFVIDNNILLSGTGISNQSQGGAYVHNLIGGKVSLRNEPNRFTPYFLPHSIEMAGLTTIYGGDDRFINNIIVGKGNQEAELTGLTGYNNVKLPVWLKSNVFYFGAQPSQKDENPLNNPSFDPRISLKEENGKLMLTLFVDQSALNHKVTPVTASDLGKTRVSKAFFENSDGTAIQFSDDYNGSKRSGTSLIAGPFESLKEGSNSICIW